MTSTEFIKWVRYLDWRDVEEFRREDYYLAQIAAQIERGQVKHPSQVTIAKKLLKFTSQDPPPPKGGRVQSSKAFWVALTGARKGAEDHRGGVSRSVGPDTQAIRRKRQEHG